MLNVAIFVEGLTDTTFIKKLIGQRYGHSGYRVTEKKLRKWEYISLQPVGASPGLGCHFLIIEVPSYDLLFSYVVDSAANMVHKGGFNLLIGLRDLHPAKRSDKATIVKFNNRILAGKPECDKIALILAIMGIEAWFLCDYHLFERIDSILTPIRIKSQLNLDLVNDDPELAYDVPSRTLKRILQLANLTYRKHEREVNTVVNNIDFNYLFSCTSKIDGFFRFVGELDRCGLLELKQKYGQVEGT